MKINILLVLLFVCFFSFGFAEDEKPVAVSQSQTEEKDWSTDISVQGVSKTVYTGQTVSDKPTMVTDLNIGSPWGVYADFWFSKTAEHLDRFDEGDYGDEVCYSIGYADEYQGFGYDIGVSYDDITHLGNSNGDAWIFYGEVNHPFEFSWQKSKLTPFVKYEYYLPFRGHEPESGGVFTLGARYEFEIYKNLSLKQELAIAHDDGHYGGQPGQIGSYDASLAYTRGIATFRVGTTIYVPLSSFDSEIDSRGIHSTNTVWYGGVTFHF